MKKTIVTILFVFMISIFPSFAQDTKDVKDDGKTKIEVTYIEIGVFEEELQIPPVDPPVEMPPAASAFCGRGC